MYGGAITVLGTPRLTLVGELGGRRVGSAGRLIEMSEPHPRLAGVDTIRLASVQEATEEDCRRFRRQMEHRRDVALQRERGRPLTTAGMNAGWISTFALDYAFGP